MRYFLNLNNTCNQNCLFCVSPNENTFVCSTKESVRIILEAIREGATTIAFSGGEPTLRDDMPFLVNFIKKVKPTIKVNILTNAVRLRYKDYTRQLRSIDSFFISLHGSTALVNDSLTRLPGSFDKTMAGAKNIQDMGKNFGFYYVITSRNYSQIIKFVKLIQSNFPKCSSIVFSFPFFCGNATKFPFILPKFKNFVPLLEKAKALCDSNYFYWDISSCGLMPFCVLNSFTRNRILKNNNIFNEKTIKAKNNDGDAIYLPTDSEFKKDNYLHTKECAKCIYRLQCPGILKKYAEIYGTRELKTIKSC